MIRPLAANRSPNRRRRQGTAKPVRRLALEILQTWERSLRQGAAPFLNELLEQKAAVHSLDRRDQALLWELVLGVVRWRGRLDYVLTRITGRPPAKLQPLLAQLLRLTAYQILFLDRIPPAVAVHEAVELAKAGGMPSALLAYLNAIGRRLAREGRQLPLPSPQAEPVTALAVTESLPPWLAARWLEQLGAEKAWQRARALNTQAPRTIRVNTAKTTPAALLEVLAAEGVTARPCAFAPEGLQLGELPGPPLALPSYRQGLWLFQDEAAQLVTYLMAPKPGQRLLEIGAGRGGKSTHLAALTGGQGLVVALDLDYRRLRQLVALQQRLGLTALAVVAADATRPLPWRGESRFDGILIDAPCSGLGTLRRHPELRWRRQPEDFQRFATLQLALLTQAAPYLRPGGRLVYVTCTTEPEENEEVVWAFRHSRPDFVLLAPPPALPSFLTPFIDPAGFFRTFPEVHGLDGFFAAVFTRGE